MNYQPAALVGVSKTACDATIISRLFWLFIDNCHAAVHGSMHSHGGVVLSSSTVKTGAPSTAAGHYTAAPPIDRGSYAGRRYEYLRHRGVEIGAYQKSVRSCNDQPTAIRRQSRSPSSGWPPSPLRLEVVNDSKFVRGRKRATEDIERYRRDGHLGRRHGTALVEPTLVFGSIAPKPQIELAA